MSNTFILSDIKVGEQVRIISYKNTLEASRMMSMGILPGEVLTVSRKTIFGTSLYIESCKMRFAIRKQEASSIIVSKE